jgi:hypothetical protein
LARGHAGAPMKGSCEVVLGRETQRHSDIEQRLISARQHLFRALQALRTHVLMGRLSRRGLEGVREVKVAQVCDSRKLGNRELPLQVGLHVFLHAG